MQTVFLESRVERREARGERGSRRGLPPSGLRIAQLYGSPGLHVADRAGATDEHAAVIRAVGRVEGDADELVGLAARARARRFAP